jgi:predicted nucleotidyltransferase
MTAASSDVLQILRTHESELRLRGVSYAAVFGSVARGEAGAASDIDVMVELDEHRAMGVFEYARLKLYNSTSRPSVWTERLSTPSFAHWRWCRRRRAVFPGT